MECGSESLAAASALFLKWRTLHSAERAEDAAIAAIRPQQRLAVAALVQELAGIRGHRLLRGETAVRAGQHGIEYDGVHSAADFRAFADFNSPLLISRPRSSAPPTKTPLTNTIGKVGHPVHIFNALRRRQPFK